MIAFRRQDKVREEVDLDLPGGRLKVTWKGVGNDVILKGEAEHVFDGTISIEYLLQTTL